MDLWIGTSGYSYPDWVGGFYPAGTCPNRMLAYYSRRFPLVELNFTFYRPPTPEMLAKLAAQTPDGFQFLVKLPQSISHERSPRDLDGFRRAVLALRRLGRLSGLLCQLPQSAHDDRPARAWIETVGRALGDLNLAVEFRHRSWAGAETTAWMAELGLSIVAVDAPDLPGLYPRGWVQSSPTAYVRMHSRNKANWYRGDKDRYDYHYDDAALQEWLAAAATAANAGTVERALFLFNNCRHSQAADNTQRMQALAAGRPPFVVEAAPAEPAPPSARCSTTLHRDEKTSPGRRVPQPDRRPRALCSWGGPSPRVRNYPP